MKAEVLALRPTQFVLGMKEVEFKVALIEGLTPAKLESYVDAHEVPCVVGPLGPLYMVDHHHFVAAAWQCRLKKVKVRLLADQHELDWPAFWAFMERQRWVYLYDQFGQGPHPPTALPLDIRGLSDDIYRSLAWELRRAGVIAKDQQPFAEFKWAEYLRATLKIDLHTGNYADQVNIAVALAKAKLAQDQASGKQGRKE